MRGTSTPIMLSACAVVRSHICPTRDRQRRRSMGQGCIPHQPSTRMSSLLGALDKAAWAYGAAVWGLRTKGGVRFDSPGVTPKLGSLGTSSRH